jgi:hypothetical protein
MFDNSVGGLDPAATLSLVTQMHRQIREQECTLVELAAHWADLHHPDGQAPSERTLPGAEQGRQLGGDGTPEVLEFAFAELGTRMETSYGSARALMADAWICGIDCPSCGSSSSLLPCRCGRPVRSLKQQGI